MRVVRQFRNADRGGRPCVAAVGNFEGVHPAHVSILRRAVELAGAAGGDTIAVCLVPPLRGRSGSTAEAVLCGLHQQIGHIGESGIETVVLRRDSVGDPDSDGWLAAVEQLAAELPLRTVVLGPAPESPQGRSVATERLRRFAGSRGIEVEIVPSMQVDGCPVSSAAIADLVDRGDVDGAARLLGRPYDVSGRVVHGFHRGRQLGFPTANLHMNRTRLPSDGVYAVRAGVGRERVAAIANIGFNPTFGVRRRVMEVHLFDFAGDLYGKRLQASFVARLRGERRFPDATALAQQIREDAARARAVLQRP